MEYVTEDQDNVLWAVKWVGREQHVLQVRTQTVNRIFIKQKKTPRTLHFDFKISYYSLTNMYWSTLQRKEICKSLSATLVFISELYVHLALGMIQRNLTVHYQMSLLNIHESTDVLYLCYDCSAEE